MRQVRVHDGATHLRALLRDPTIADRLSVDECVLVLTTIGWVTTRLASRLTRLLTAGRLLTGEEAARRLGTTPDWLATHADALPFTVRMANRQLRFSEAGLAAYSQAHAGRTQHGAAAAGAR